MCLGSRLKSLQHSTRLEMTRSYMIILDQLFFGPHCFFLDPLMWVKLFAACSFMSFEFFWYSFDILWSHAGTMDLSITSGEDAKTPAKKGMAGLAGPWAWVSRAVVELCSKTMQDLGWLLHTSSYFFNLLHRDVQTCWSMLAVPC